MKKPRPIRIEGDIGYVTLTKGKTHSLNDLSPKALSAAMRGGTDQWGKWGSVMHHVRYAEAVNPHSRRRCYCGCKRRATHKGMANGVALTTACEFAIQRWIGTGRCKP